VEKQKEARLRTGLLSETSLLSVASWDATLALGHYFVCVCGTVARWRVHVLGSAVHSRRCWSGSHLSWSFTSRLLLGTRLRRPLLVHFIRCATRQTAHDSARESTMTGRMTCDAANECAFDAAFGDSNAWGECNREGYE
jgi:hypothetical protein